MTWVKICGITNLEDALAAVDAGADAVGFVFHPPSPRNISAEAAGKIAARLPKATEKVGVFVGEIAGGIAAKKRTAHQAGLTGIQVYGYGSQQAVNQLGSLVEKLFVAWPANVVFSRRISGRLWRSKDLDKPSAIFLDSGTTGQYGGTGRTFDWKKAAIVLSKIDESVKFVIAGGLTAENVAEAIAILKPWGVDVASGVEIKPGKKDPEKVRAFVRAVRAAERPI